MVRWDIWRGIVVRVARLGEKKHLSKSVEVEMVSGVSTAIVLAMWLPNVPTAPPCFARAGEGRVNGNTQSGSGQRCHERERWKVWL